MHTDLTRLNLAKPVGECSAQKLAEVLRDPKATTEYVQKALGSQLPDHTHSLRELKAIVPIELREQEYASYLFHCVQFGIGNPEISSPSKK